MADLDELKQAHGNLYDSYEQIVQALGAADWDRATGCPGWSVRDILAHVVGVEAILAGEAEPQHELPTALPHVRNDLGRYMEVHVDARRHVPTDELAAELRDVFARRRRQLTEVGDLGEEIRSVMGTTGPAAPLLTIRVLDLWLHEQDLRRALGHPGHRTGPAVDVALRRIAKGLASQLPERLGDASGVVVIRVDGDAPRTVAVDLGSGGAPDRAPADVAATLHVDLDGFLALAGGRADAPSVDGPRIDGDRGLGERVVGALAVTP